ncbi:MAG: hypothetical protein AB8C84_12035 [Oligoflexales bacterium]
MSFILLLIISLTISCEEGAVEVTRTKELGAVDISSTSQSSVIILPTESSAVTTSNGSLIVPEGTFPDGAALTKVSALEDNKEGFSIKSTYINGDVAIPHQDMQICVETKGDPFLKDMKVLSDLDDKLSIESGVVSSPELCLLTRVASGSFEVIDEVDGVSQNTVSKKIERGYFQILSAKKSALGEIYLTTELKDYSEIPGSVEILWTGKTNSQSDLQPKVKGKICLYAGNDDIGSISQMHSDQSVTHYVVEKSEKNELCILSEDLYGIYQLGPKNTKALALRDSLDLTGNSAEIIVSPVDQGSMVSVYDNSSCLGEALASQKSSVDGEVIVQLSLAEGLYELHSQVINKYGAAGHCSKEAFHYNADFTAPVIESISIQDSSEYTNLNGVVIFSSVEDASEMYITNTPGCSADGVWEPYQSRRAEWLLSGVNSATEVYAKFRDESGNITDCVSDSIIHDNQSPTSISLLILGGSYTSDATPDLTLSALGASEMYITNTSGCSAGGVWESYNTSKLNWSLSHLNSSLGVYAKFRDEAHNESNCVNDSIIHDDQSPSSSSLLIVGGTHTSDAAPDLVLLSSGASEMYITNTTGCAVGGVWEAYSTSKTNWGLGHSNASTEVYVKFRDESGNETICISDSIVHDDQSPLSSLLVISGGDYTSDSTPDLVLSSSGASEMYITNTSGCSAAGVWESYSASKLDWSLTQLNAVATVYVKFRDEANNETSCMNDSIVHDATAPTNPSVLVAGGDNDTLFSSVNLSLSADNADEMYITNISNCDSGGVWETYATTKANWSLGQLNAATTVYIKFRDSAHNETSCVNDSIIHDDQPPTSPSLLITGGHETLDTAPDLTLAAFGASEMYITNTSGCASNGTWESYSTSKSNWSLAQTNTNATVYVKYKDTVGNETNCVNDTIIHDDVVPASPSLAISSGASYTTSSTVTLSPNAIDADYMYITNTSGCGSGGTWESYASTKTGWMLEQTNATAAVYIKYKDEADNMTSCVSDFIVHDNIVPSDPGAFVDGVQTQNLLATNTMTWTVSHDAGSGISGYEISVGTSASATNIKDWTSMGNVTSGVLSGLSLVDGITYYANIRSVDLAGNVSSVVSGDGFNAMNDPVPAGLSVGNYHVCARLTDGSMKCWGWNPYGQLGQGDVENLGDIPSETGDGLAHVQLGTGRTAIGMSSGYFDSCALLDNNQVKCWGYNYSGSAGQGHTDAIGDDASEMGDNLSAVDLGTNRTALEIDSSRYHNCARLDNNQVKCWGGNEFGQLGQGNISNLGDSASEMGDNLSVIDLGTNRTALEVSLGEYFSCVRLDNNQVKCWGKNAAGQLGQGHTNPLGDGSSEMGDNLAAINLGTNRTAIQISAGYDYACALLDNNQVKCWGTNFAGQLGQGHTNSLGDGGSEMGDNLTVIDLGTNRTATFIETGYDNTCALLDNGELKCWGGNGYGELGLEHSANIGDGSTEMGNHLNAVDLGTNRTAVSVSIGRYTTCAQLDNNTVKCWGYNVFGQLGQGHANHLIGDNGSEMGDDLPVTDL